MTEKKQILKRPDSFSEHAHKLPYASNVSGPAMVIPNTDEFKTERGTQAKKFFDEKLDQLRREYEAIISLAEQTQLVYNARYNFVPKVGKVYHLYQHSDERPFLSMIAPNEWRNSYTHLGSYCFTADAVWERIDDQS